MVTNFSLRFVAASEPLLAAATTVAPARTLGLGRRARRSRQPLDRSHVLRLPSISRYLPASEPSNLCENRPALAHPGELPICFHTPRERHRNSRRRWAGSLRQHAGDPCRIGWLDSDESRFPLTRFHGSTRAEVRGELRLAIPATTSRRESLSPTNRLRSCRQC